MPISNKWRNYALRPGRTSLAMDMMEEFRAHIGDRFALSLINKRQSNNKMLTATIETLNKKIDALTREVEDLKARNEELTRTQLIGRVNAKDEDDWLNTELTSNVSF